VMARDIIFFSLAGPVGDYTGAHTVIFREVFFFILFSRRKSEAAMGRSGGSIVFFRVPNSLQGCDGWGEGNIINQSLFGPVERYTPLTARVRA
jgi:hypothetical protein